MNPMFRSPFRSKMGQKVNKLKEINFESDVSFAFSLKNGSKGEQAEGNQLDGGKMAPSGL